MRAFAALLRKAASEEKRQGSARALEQSSEDEVANQAARMPERAPDEADFDPSAAPLEQRLEEHWRDEPSDPIWRDQATAYITTALQDARIAPESLYAVDCARTLCRAQLKFSSPDEPHRAYELRHPDHDMQFFAHGDQYIVYFAREHAHVLDALPDQAPL